MEVAFILDRIPSYLLVISKLHNVNPASAEVAKDDARPSEASAPGGEIMFRILSLSMLESDDKEQLS